GRSRFQSLFDWTGTADPTALLCVPAAIQCMQGLLPGGWEAVRAHNRALAVAARDLLCTELGLEPPCPDQMLGSMATIPVPGADIGISERLFARHRVEVPVKADPAGSAPLLRISAQLYNRLEDYQRLADLLKTECSI